MDLANRMTVLRRFLLLLFATGICFFLSGMALAGDEPEPKEELTIWA